MSWYPFEYQGVLEYQRNERIDLGTSSDEAAKHFDAFVTGIVLRFVDSVHQQSSSVRTYFGNFVHKYCKFEYVIRQNLDLNPSLSKYLL